MQKLVESFVDWGKYVIEIYKYDLKDKTFDKLERLVFNNQEECEMVRDNLLADINNYSHLQSEVIENVELEAKEEPDTYENDCQ